MFFIEKDGLTRCASGTIVTFAQELIEKILPFVYTCIVVEFNGKRFEVSNDDTVDNIIDKWRNVDYQKDY